MIQIPSADSPRDAWLELERAAQVNAFALLGLPVQFDVDESLLRVRFLSMTRDLHPDGLSQASPDVQSAAMRVLSRVNAAYEALREPLRRAETVLMALGGKSAAEDKRVPPEVLTQTLMLREELEDARGAGNTQAIADIRAALTSQRANSMRQIAALARDMSEHPLDEHRHELRLRLNAIKYIDNLLVQATA